MLLQENRKLGQTVITDQELYAQSGCKFVVNDKPRSWEDQANQPSFRLDTHYFRLLCLPVIHFFCNLVMGRLQKEGQSGLTSKHGLENSKGIGIWGELMYHGVGTFFGYKLNRGFLELRPRYTIISPRSSPNFIPDILFFQIPVDGFMVGYLSGIRFFLHIKPGLIRVNTFGQPGQNRCKHPRTTTHQSRVRETDFFPCELPCLFGIGNVRFRRRPFCYSSGLSSGSLNW